jgi:hypothetical protein
MPLKPISARGIALAATAVAGAGAAAIGSAAASSGHHPAASSHHGHATARHHPGRGRGGPLRRAVHLEAVVPRPGGGFATATVDRGVLVAVHGRTLTLRQGDRRATWRTRAFTVPADARVVIEHKAGSLGGIRTGQVVVVAHLPRRTVVRAHDRRR